jgi:hypothetical protein
VLPGGFETIALCDKLSQIVQRNVRIPAKFAEPAMALEVWPNNCGPPAEMQMKGKGFGDEVA